MGQVMHEFGVNIGKTMFNSKMFKQIMRGIMFSANIVEFNGKSS